jgi:hypothetical protein
MNPSTDVTGDVPEEKMTRTARADDVEAKEVVMVSTEGVAQTRKRKDEGDGLDLLFTPESAKGFRAQWDAVQRSFVDDPKQAVKEGDELVTSVIKTLEESFKTQRQRLSEDIGGGEANSTENLRIALRRYRSFFERLLAV